VGHLRPERTVRGPSGDYWELYVSKTRLPPWRQGQSGDSSLTDDPFDAVGLLLALLGAIWSSFLLPLFRFFVALPFAVVKGRRSRAIRIEAVNHFPMREVLLWTTTEGQVKGVLDEIAAGLAEGKVVQPTGAVYSGVQTD
jgi:hypothetical protein